MRTPKEAFSNSLNKLLTTDHFVTILYLLCKNFVRRKKSILSARNSFPSSLDYSNLEIQVHDFVPTTFPSIITCSSHHYAWSPAMMTVSSPRRHFLFIPRWRHSVILRWLFCGNLQFHILPNQLWLSQIATLGELHRNRCYCTILLVPKLLTGGPCLTHLYIPRSFQKHLTHTRCSIITCHAE